MSARASAGRLLPREGLLSRHSDLLLAVGVIAIVAMMIVALPPLAIDTLVVISLLGGVALLLLSIYIRSPIEFSAFPSVLLLTTLFRLALAVATTRAILLDGHAGHVIETFGKTVAGGNLVVGLVTFTIITVVQFIVIAKGAERIAEVSARFTLDAMPGKQMSIDSDLRSGLIDKLEARRRRETLELESALHGNLDGAMKFVKGDAIAGIVIILVNLIGGLAVGVMQKGMDVATALHRYSILTIGDGLAAQIPALLGAMAAALIVTRTQSDESDRHLGDSIRKQIGAKPRVLLVSGGVCMLLAVVPGFPAAVFLLLGGTVAATGVALTPALADRVRRLLPGDPELERVEVMPVSGPIDLPAEPVVVAPMQPLTLELRGGDAARLPMQDLAARLEGVQRDLQSRIGLVLPRIAMHVEPQSDAPGWRLLAWEVPIAGAAMEPGASPDPEAIAAAVHGALRRNGVLFVGTQEVAALFNKAAEHWPDLVRDAQRTVPLHKATEVVKRLVEEEVGVRNLRGLLETFVEPDSREADVHTLTEQGRVALRRQILHRHAPEGTLRVLMIDPGVEDFMRQSIRTVGAIQHLALDPPVAMEIVKSVGATVARTGVTVVLTSIDLRRHLRKLIEADLFDVTVLSYHELSPTLKLDVVGRVEVGPPDGRIPEGPSA
ncbi:MAG: FHIPEP family type III secretion protein [Burkholderiales bacterium]